MDDNPYAAPESPTAAAIPGDDERRIASAKRLGRRSLYLIVGGFAVGGGCAIVFALRADGQAHPLGMPVFIAVAVVGLAAELTMLGGIVIALLAVMRGALRRRPESQQSSTAPRKAG